MMRRFLFIGIGLLLLVSCTQKAVFQKNSNLVFGTIYNITYQYADDLQSEIEAELQKVDGEFSMFNPQSTVARINGGDSAVVRSAMFQEIYELSQTVNKETDGAFDIHVAPLVNAWGFGFKHDQLPTPQQVDSLLQIRDQMDFSAVAKGFGCDVVARLLRSHGIENFMVEIGGEMVLSGHNDKGQPWHIGVNKPVEGADDGDLQTVLAITDCAIATSGNYRNFYYKDGQRYAHTIDPRTGYPVQHSLLSATVVAADCATADAYATSFMVLGLDSAQAVLNSHPELKAYLIYSDESGQMSVWRSETLDCEL